MPDTEMAEDFESQDLASIFGDLGLVLHAPRDTDETESGRPSKKIKLVKEPSPFDMITSQLWQLLGSQNATGLDGLGQIAE
jgi:hypothetical protein